MNVIEINTLGSLLFACLRAFLRMFSNPLCSKQGSAVILKSSAALNYLSNDLSNELKRVMREKALNQDAMVNEDIVRMSIEKTKALVDVLNKQASMKRPPGLDTSSLSDMGSEISDSCQDFLRFKIVY